MSKSNSPFALSERGTKIYVNFLDSDKIESMLCLRPGNKRAALSHSHTHTATQTHTHTKTHTHILTQSLNYTDTHTDTHIITQSLNYTHTDTHTHKHTHAQPRKIGQTKEEYRR